jgi:predicted glycosyltransferase
MLRTTARLVVYAAGRTGVGHIRRAIRLAEYAFHSGVPGRHILVIVGTPGADRLFGTHPFPVVAPPALIQLSRMARRSLDVGGQVVIAAEEITKLIADARAEVLITTTHRGVAGELTRVLTNEGLPPRRRVLVLRDIYYPPEFVADYQAMTEADFDDVLICGPNELRGWAPRGIDAGLRDGARSVGYLRPLPEVAPRLGSTNRGFIILCQVGGGVDGRTRVDAVIAAAERARSRTACPIQLEVSTGPLMPEDDVTALLRSTDSTTRVDRWWASSAALSADLSISMAGYNSCVEAAWFRTPAILMPREEPDDLEQAVRADYFARWLPEVEVVKDVDEGAITDSIVSRLQEPAPRGQSSLASYPADMFASPADLTEQLLG